MEENKTLLSLLILHEIGLRTLYRRYSEKFPELETFWLEMSEEESEHVKMLQELDTNLKLLPVSERGRFNVQALKIAMGFVRQQIKGADQVSSIKEALSIALDFENTALEKGFFSAFERKTALAEQIFADIREHTLVHYNKLKEWVNKY